MSTAINVATFVATGEIVTKSFGTMQEGTVEVTLHSTTKRCRAMKMVSTCNGVEVSITAYDLVGKYQTGNKLWSANITQYIDSPNPRRVGCESGNFGRDDRDPKFKKLGYIWHRPEAK